MKCKSFIAIILIFILCASCSFTGYANLPDIDDAPYSEDILDLYKLGIVDAKEDGTFDPYNTVTRAEFCHVLVKLNGMDAHSVVSDKQYFADVPQSHAYFDEIGFAASRGFINGYPDGNFYPDAYITYDQVNKIIIDFLGYKYMADMRGGYPNGYRVTAANLGLSDDLDLSFEISINRAELCKYINNALDVPLVELVGIGEDGIYEVKDDVTILTKYLKLKRISGFVEANAFYTLTDQEAVDGCIVIDGINYKINDVTFNDYIGKLVKAIVKIDDSKKQEEILLINEDESNEIILTHNNYINYQNLSLTYDLADSKQKTVKIAPDVKLIYNGTEKVFDGNYINNLSNGTIRLISKNANNVYDVIIVSDYTSFVVDRKNEYRQIVYDPYGTTSLDFSKDIIYNITDSTGKVVSYEDITIGSVITFFENSKFAEGFVTNYTVSGTLSELGQDGDITFAIINNEKINLNATTTAKVKSIGLGNQIKLYVDAFDMAVFAEKIAVNTDKIKYLFKLGNSSEGALDSILMGKFYDIDNGIEIYEFAKDVRINGTTIKNAKKSDITISIPQMVQIKTDENNKITSVTTPRTYEEIMSNPGDDGFCEVFPFKTRKFQVDSDSFDNKIMFNQNSTKIMVVPENMSDYSDKDFKTVTSTTFTNDGEYNIAAYNSTADYVIPEMIVCKMSASQSTNIELSKGDKLFVVTGKTQTTNEDGDVLTKVTGFVGSKETYFYIDPQDTIIDKYDSSLNVNDLTVGDIIFYNKNSDGYIKAFTRFYNETKGYEQKISFINSFNRPIVVLNSQATKIADPYIYFLDTQGDNPYDYYMFKTNNNVAVVSKDQRGETQVTGGTTADIDIGDKIIIHIRYTIVESIVVFKN
ncbi:MAG: S-layer homology domain-containing protein [Clostridia bacterium]|nr:S-layer homology domain-containing protein [Clostridia bacterium]